MDAPRIRPGRIVTRPRGAAGGFLPRIGSMKLLPCGVVLLFDNRIAARSQGRIEACRASRGATITPRSKGVESRSKPCRFRSVSVVFRRVSTAISRPVVG
jgi:hypothetical protein